jgi:hypothetical protein
MGIATPKTGAISFSQLNTGILNASSTAQLNMNTAAQRLGYSTTGQVSMSNLRGCTGGEFTIGQYYDSKIDVTYTGYVGPLSTGSITGELYATNDGIVSGIYNNKPGNLTPPGPVASFELVDPDDLFSVPPTGWNADAVTRAAISNTERTISGAGGLYVPVTYTMPVSGTTTWGLKFG